MGAPGARAPRRWLRDHSLTQKASLNVLTRTLEHMAMVAVGILINPLLVAGLGTYAFGLWQVLRQLSGYLTPATGRPTQALKWTVSTKQTWRACGGMQSIGVAWKGRQSTLCSA